MMNGREPADERCVRLAEYVIEQGATVRGTAAVFGVSKSTVHKDIAYRLPYINRALYLEVKDVLERNKAERHIRGGEATREKYMALHESADKLKQAQEPLHN